MNKNFYVRKNFMVFMVYFLIGGLFTAYGADRYRFKGPKYQAPEATEAIRHFREKCIEFKIESICAYGFQNLVRVDLVDDIWYQPHFSNDIVSIGLAEYSFFSPLTKISIDKKLLVDKVFFNTTVIHELGHAVLDLDHNDDKPAIMNSSISDVHLMESQYEVLIDDMFKDFSDSLK